jgi:hypothetical protein
MNIMAFIEVISLVLTAVALGIAVGGRLRP